MKGRTSSHYEREEESNEPFLWKDEVVHTSIVDVKIC